MDIKGTYTFDAPIARVWNLLMDPAAIAACIPGCQELTPLGEDRYRAVLVVPVSVITGNYTGTIAVADKVPLRSYRLTVEGTGRGGFVRGQSAITLTDRGEQTVVALDRSVERAKSGRWVTSGDLAGPELTRRSARYMKASAVRAAMRAQPFAFIQ